MPDGYQLRGFDHGDLEALWHIERRATGLLADQGYPQLVLSELSLTEFETSLTGKGVWVAAGRGNDAIGYACAGQVDTLFWLHQMSVDPAHGNNGIGTALLAAVVDHAKWAFHNAIGLTTFKDVAFNAPFYSKAGFLRVNRDSAAAWLQQQFDDECPHGVDPSTRTIMVRKL